MLLETGEGRGVCSAWSTDIQRSQTFQQKYKKKLCCTNNIPLLQVVMIICVIDQTTHVSNMSHSFMKVEKTCVMSSNLESESTSCNLITVAFDFLLTILSCFRNEIRESMFF